MTAGIHIGCRHSPKKTTRLGDLPDLILVEILAGLACKSTLFRAKCVSKRWLSLLSDPYFVRTFLSVQGVDEGNAFLGAEKERHVHLELVATYNDLVLCCKTYTIYDDEDMESYLIHNPYYICNPYTKKWLALPPGNHLRVPSSCTTYVGFICEPYFKQQHSEQASSKITLNAEYRWSVVQMLIPLEPSMHQLRMDIFSSETGQWRPLV
ncbi:PREDICTED: putative F-box protein At1g50870 [Fragaria vesca subsp. vesca]|uniref:putative F-box protein At1g50870 n=1 Tax=Fragaria vesca subsp. vesca TaxID=101020 RepID=UPI0002C36AD4|nr:PREDICTED: putative F-box protein At1g50870 [Fragaria vesca subsp. vesca]